MTGSVYEVLAVGIDTSFPADTLAAIRTLERSVYAVLSTINVLALALARAEL